MSVTYAIYKDNLRVSKEFPYKAQAQIEAFEMGYVTRGKLGRFVLEGVEIREQDYLNRRSYCDVVSTERRPTCWSCGVPTKGKG